METSHVDFSVHAESDALMPGRAVWLAFQFKMEPGWKIYYKNPGNSGLPTRIQADLPEGFELGQLNWPVPDTTEIEGIITHDYGDEMILLALLRADENTSPGDRFTIPIRASWLECEVVCIPGQAATEIEVLIGPSQAIKENAALFQRSRSRMPRIDKDFSAYHPFEGDESRAALKLSEAMIDYNFSSFISDNSKFQSHKIKASGVQEDYILLSLPTNQKYEKTSGLFFFTNDQAEKKVLWSSFEKGEISKKSSRPSLLKLFVWAFLGGLLLNLMPCVFPVLTLKIFSFVRQGGEAIWKVRLQGFLYSLGVVLAFLAIALLLILLKSGGLAIGWGFQLQHPVFLIFMITLMFLIGLNLVGVFEVGTFMVSLGGKIPRKNHMLGAFASGVLAVFIATPCSAPFMGAAIGAALSMPVAEALSVFLFLGLGMAFPYFLLSFIPGLAKKLPKPGAWMEWLKETLSFPIFLTALWLLWVYGQVVQYDALFILLLSLIICAMAAWFYGRMSTPDKPKWQRRMGLALPLIVIGLSMTFAIGNVEYRDESVIPSSVMKDRWEAFSQAKLEEYFLNREAVFVDFTAAWCLSCQVNKRTVLDQAKIQQAFADKKVRLMRADWTTYDPKITSYLESFDRASVPLYLLFDRSGDVQVLPELLTVDAVYKAVSQIKAE